MTEYLGQARGVLIQGHRTAQNNARQARQQAQTVTIYGHTSISGIGEANYDINFPVLFVEKPTFCPGLEFAEGSSALDLNYPTWGATVNRWIYKQIGNVRYWVGASIVVSIAAQEGASFVVHHSFTGTALHSPGFAIEGLGESI